MKSRRRVNSNVMLLSDMDGWLKRNATFAYVLLVVLGIVGAWLVGLFEGESNPTQEITGLDLALSFFGLVILCAALLGIVLLIARNRKAMTIAQGVTWERVREKGKWFYVRNYTIRASAMIILVMLILAFIDYSHGELRTNLKIYFALTGGIIGAIIYSGIRFWGYYEAEYRSLQSKSQHNKSLDASGDSASRN